MQRKINLKLIILFALFLSSVQVKSQIALGLQASYIAPLSNEKYILKPTAGIELKVGGGDIDKRFKLGFSIGYMGFKSTQDTFRIYGTYSGSSTTPGGTPINGGNGGTILMPGWEHIYNYRMGFATFSSDFKILKKKLSPIIGLDLGAYIVTLNEDYQVEELGSLGGKYENETTWEFSLIPRVGVSYELKEKWLLTGGLGRNVTFYSSAELRAFWKTYIGIMYYF